MTKIAEWVEQWLPSLAWAGPAHSPWCSRPESFGLMHGAKRKRNWFFLSFSFLIRVYFLAQVSRRQLAAYCRICAEWIHLRWMNEWTVIGRALHLGLEAKFESSLLPDNWVTLNKSYNFFFCLKFFLVGGRSLLFLFIYLNKWCLFMFHNSEGTKGLQRSLRTVSWPLSSPPWGKPVLSVSSLSFQRYFMHVQWNV